jgi:hypothetical protein
MSDLSTHLLIEACDRSGRIIDERDQVARELEACICDRRKDRGLVVALMLAPLAA